MSVLNWKVLLQIHRYYQGIKLITRVETPVYRDLSEQDTRSIILKPLIPRGFVEKKRSRDSILFLKVSLVDDPTGLQIASWLRSFPPSILRGVDVEALVLKARNIEDLGSTDDEAIFPGSILGNLSSSARREILQQIQGLSQVVQSTAASAQYAASHASQTPPAGVANQSLAAHAAQAALRSLTEGVTAVQDSMETRILFDENVNLEEALHDTATMAAGSQDTLALKQHIFPTVEKLESLEITKGCVKFRNLDNNPRFRYGIQNDAPVILEFSYYEQDSPVDYGTEARMKLERMVKLLSISKRKSFSVLDCHGYIHEPHKKRFGVVFSIPGTQDAAQLPKHLQDFYSIHKSISLDTRLKLAFTLARTLSNFHKVGWVHKKFNSANILFFPRLPSKPSNTEGGELRTSPDDDLEEPWLFGFECSRPTEADTLMETDYNIDPYRHPERWGKAAEKFDKAHDIYGLV